MQTVVIVCNIRPSIEYESEVWEGNKSQAGSLESNRAGLRSCRAQLENIFVEPQVHSQIIVLL